MSQLRDVDNKALVSSRVVNDSTFAHVFVSDKPVDKIFLSNKTSTNAYVFPLYFYPEISSQLSFTDSAEEPPDRVINLSPGFIVQCAELLKMTFVSEDSDLSTTFGPDDLFNYIYAICYSPTYRQRYAEFLKVDFPRLPLTANSDLFRQLCAVGSELVRLHLMKQFPRMITTYPVAGDNVVENVRYTAPTDEQGRVSINREQFFLGVPSEVWDFHVGGYRVCEKWLKDRRGRKLTYDELTQYQNIVSALNETLRLMLEIDQIIQRFGGWPIT